MKKRLMIYLSVLVGCLFIGFTTFYLAKNYETISVTASSGNEIYLNVKETESLSITHTYPAESTTLSYVITDKNVISFDLETGVVTALAGGESKLTISSSNENFGPFEFKFLVGDGASPSTPYYIKTATDLKAIGGTRTYSETSFKDWSLNSYYELINDIDLKDSNWQPIGSFTDDDNYLNDRSFSGDFNGNDRVIKNLTINEVSSTYGSAKSAGLFASLSRLANIYSLQFDNATITGTFDFAGVLAGVSTGSTINRVEIKNSSILATPVVYQDKDLHEAYLMTGGVIGACLVTHWEEQGSKLSDYAYTRTTITMCSFTGSIGTMSNTFETVSEYDNSYIAFGGIVGYNLGSILLNNKATVDLSLDSRFSTISEKVNLMAGGIIGVVDTFIIEDELRNEVDIVYPLVKNNLAIITCNNPSSKTNGVIGKVPLNIFYKNGEEGWILGNYYFNQDSNINFGGSSVSNATIKISSIQALSEKSTYSNWEIGDSSSISAWILGESDSSPIINALGLDEEISFPGQEIYTISDSASFKYYYDKMIMSATSDTEILSKKFWLSQNYVLEGDINLAEAGINSWIPIGHDYSFMGTFNGNGFKIYFENEDSSTILFDNLENKYIYAGIFGVLNSTAKVENLTIEDFSINSVKYAGGIAGINAGRISGCNVNKLKITNSSYAGGITGKNGKDILNCTVQSVDISGCIYCGFFTAYNEGSILDDDSSESDSINGLNKISITTLDSSIYAGGAVGFNKGKISNIRISSGSLIISEITTEDVNRAIGGFVGFNSGDISDCSITSSYLSDNSKIRLYMGGFCAINDGLINNCYTGTPEEFSIVRADLGRGNQTVGGFVARLGYDGIITNSFAIADVFGYYSAGLVADLLGVVDSCYVKGSVKGEFIGAFACNLAFKGDLKGGTLTNSYSTVTLIGASEGSISAGLVLFIRTPGKVEYCFASNTFSPDSLGKKYFESYTDTRFQLVQNITKKIAPIEALGTVNSIIINIGENEETYSYVTRNGKRFADAKQVVLYLTTEECISGQKGEITNIYESIGFSISPTSYWSFNGTAYPTLVKLNLNGISQETPLGGDVEEPAPDSEEPAPDSEE